MFAALTTLLAIPSLVGLAIGLILTFIDNTNSD
ncbi:hypothetical protein F4555_000578 [Mobiluncus mulieris]|uniref:Uncharacterized protein n=1 Tax=Mobiluncus mulieris TaxID=2052 RepID=A0A8G2HTZ0_9ACTO|nr:hypothetical protein [Mobiluncus mulieris]STO15558.1 Uncharacterised protein [Mobiluncus mulieris]